MIASFKSEFARISLLVSAGLTVKKISELQDYIQGYNFDNPLINWTPMASFNSRMGASGQMIYEGRCVLDFITKAVKSDNLEDVKDLLVQDMIDLSTNFFRQLNKNENSVFLGPQFSVSNDIDRNFTANYCVSVRSTITFMTSCANLIQEQEEVLNMFENGVFNVDGVFKLGEPISLT